MPSIRKSVPNAQSSTTNTKLVIGMIGLGEVGSRFAAGLTRAGHAEILGYDPHFHIDGTREKEIRLRESKTRLVQSPQALAAGADVLIAVVSCEIACQTAEKFSAFLHSGQYYLDLSSAVPKKKKEIEAVIRQSGAHFLDGGILNSPEVLWEKTPVVLSGPEAASVAARLNACGMSIRALGSEIGQASGLKILRSIFAKSLEALLLETYTAADYYGVLPQVQQALLDMFEREAIAPMFERMVATDAVHALRRAKEIESMAQVLEADRLDSTMSRAAAKKLYWSASSGMQQALGGHIPENYRCVVRYMEEYQKSSRRT